VLTQAKNRLQCPRRQRHPGYDRKTCANDIGLSGRRISLKQDWMQLHCTFIKPCPY